jgi:hypothetical protein
MTALLLTLLFGTPALAQPCSDAAPVDGDRYVPAQTVAFAPRTADPTPEAREAMAAVACAMQTDASRVVHIGVHTDSQGSGAYNERVSQERADALKALLVEAGIDPTRITAVGYGEDVPIAPNTTAEGRDQNRRVELRTTAPSTPAPAPAPQPVPVPRPQPDPCTPLPTPDTPCAVTALCPVDGDTYIECMHGEWVRITERPVDP